MRKRSQILKIVDAGFMMVAGLALFKWVPMLIWGPDILFDASMHIMTVAFVLYCIWFFVDQNPDWHVPFFIFASLVLFVISVQRIVEDAHNDVGLILAFAISVLSIAIAERANLKGKFRF